VENPVKGNMIHVFSNITEPKIELRDINGRLISGFISKIGNNEYQITVGRKTSGLMMIKAKGKNQVFTKKIILNLD